MFIRLKNTLDMRLDPLTTSLNPGLKRKSSEPLEGLSMLESFNNTILKSSRWTSAKLS